MQFVLNTALDPHFCALFDEQGSIIDEQSWENRRHDGHEVFAFLSTHAIHEQTLLFAGGVSGPGGFSSLRAGAGILNALETTHQCPLHQVRAEVWVHHFLKSQGHEIPCVLNSFGDGVFLSKTPGDLQRFESVEDLLQITKEQPCFVESLPPSKKDRFPQKTTLLWAPESTSKALLESLQNTNPRPRFLPDYEFPAV